MGPGGRRGLAQQQDGQQQQQQETQDRRGNQRVPLGPGGVAGQCSGQGPEEPMCPMTDHHFLLVIPWGSPELLGLGVQGAQAEVAPDWPPNRNQLPLHRHQRVL